MIKSPASNNLPNSHNKELELLTSLSQQIKAQRESLARRIAKYKNRQSHKNSTGSCHSEEKLAGTLSSFRHERMRESYTTAIPVFMKRQIENKVVKQRSLNKTFDTPKFHNDFVKTTEDIKCPCYPNLMDQDKSSIKKEWAESLKKQVEEEVIVFILIIGTKKDKKERTK